MKCSTCETTVIDESEAIFERGYWWHRSCYRNDFPAEGKLIPLTIQTFFPEPAKAGAHRR